MKGAVISARPHSEVAKPAKPAIGEPLPSLFVTLSATEKGLSGQNAIDRLATYGLNQIDDHASPSLAHAVFNRFRNPLVLVLIATSLVAVSIALVLPYTAFGGWFGLAPLSPGLLGALAMTTFAYLCVVYVVRRWFSKRYSFG